MTLTLIALVVGLALEAPPPIKEPALRDELVKRMKADQDARAGLMKLRSPEDYQRPEVKAMIERMKKVDQDNLGWFKGVVERHGWPGKSLVGEDGAQGAFLIAQHAVDDLEFMAKCLGLLKEAYKAGEAEGQSVALMTDRLLVRKETKKQLYGTQLMTEGDKLVPLPIEDEANVDKRRRELGMMPLAEYLKMVNSLSK